MTGKNTVWIVVGTRPNFVKVTRFKAVAKAFDNLEVKIVHTGQHYDTAMSGVFFDQFGLRPDRYLGVKPDTPSRQIAETIVKLDELFANEKPAMVMVVGDVNATLAGAIAANKNNLPLAHLESGLRSGDRTMPEEHNRLVADALADLHFVTEDSGLQNLRSEGKDENGISFVGNTMIDTLIAFESQVLDSEVLRELGLSPKGYALVTIHRPSNVDDRDGLEMLAAVLRMIAEKLPVVFATHPRTDKRMEDMDMTEVFSSISGLKMVPAQAYFDFQRLLRDARFVLTDSGGIQEETTFLQMPCLTLRPNTERPVTVSQGSNTLLEFNVNAIGQKVDVILENEYKAGVVPTLWDGGATERVLDRINTYFERGY